MLPNAAKDPTSDAKQAASSSAARPSETADATSVALCASLATWRFENLPTSVVRTLKVLVTDALGLIAGAANAPGIVELNDRLSRWESGGSATGLIGSRRFSPPTAALANGAAVHAFDFDDVHDTARVHSMCVVLPAVLATAEDLRGVSGRDFLTALAVGTELHARLGLACDCVPLGWQPTTLLGSLAASVATGTLLKLDAPRLADALGLAFHQAGGTLQASIDGSLGKRIGPGFGARNAVVSAFLAADGVTGPRASLEGRAGLFTTYMRGVARPDILFDNLGTRWHIPEYSVKPYPACRASHGAIAVAAALRDEGVSADAVRSIEIALSKSNWRLVNGAYDPGRDSIAHAQFNACYGFAQAFVHGEVGLKAYTRPAISDGRVVDLTRRTRVVVDPAMEPGAIAPVAITLELEDGRSIVRRTTTLKGDADAPMTDDELLAKLRDCFSFGLDAPAEAADRVAAAVADLEHATDAAAVLCDAFAAADRSRGAPHVA